MASAIVRSTLRTALRAGARVNPASKRSFSSGASAEEEAREASKWEKITYVGIAACSILAFVNLSKGHPHFEEPPVMGNASTLVQSDDWAALIADAKTRECYMDMDSIPKDFMGPKVPPPPVYGPPQARFSNMRGLKRPGLRHRSYDHMDSRSEDDEKTNSSFPSRNGNHRPLKPPADGFLDDVDQSGDRSREAWQQGIQKRPNSNPITGKRDP